MSSYDDLSGHDPVAEEELDSAPAPKAPDPPVTPPAPVDPPPAVVSTTSS